MYQIRILKSDNQTLRGLIILLGKQETWKFHDNHVFPTAAAIKNGPGEIIRKMKKNSLHSRMRHLALTCCIILQSIINLFRWLLRNRPEMKLKIWIRGHN